MIWRQALFGVLDRTGHKEQSGPGPANAAGLDHRGKLSGKKNKIGLFDRPRFSFAIWVAVAFC